jgi:hypothetical protein
LHQEVFTAECDPVSGPTAYCATASSLEIYKLYSSCGAGNAAADDRGGRPSSIDSRDLIVLREFLNTGWRANYSPDCAGRGVTDYRHAIVADGDGASPVDGERERVDPGADARTWLPMAK